MCDKYDRIKFLGRGKQRRNERGDEKKPKFF